MADPYDTAAMIPAKLLTKGREASDFIKQLFAGLAHTAGGPGRNYGVEPSLPGQWSEEDEARRQIADRRRVTDAADIAMLGLGTPGVPKGALGAGGRAPKGRAVPIDEPALPGVKQYPVPTDARISTRFPSAARSTEDPMLHNLSIGAAEMKLDPKLFAHNTAVLGEAPGFAHLKGKSPDEAARGYINQAADNMEFLFRNSPDVMQKRSPLWYEGANRISEALANRWGIPRPAASGGLAALSPQKDWYQNASLGERTGDIMFGATAGKKMTPEMLEYARGNPALSKEGSLNADMVRRIQGKSLDQLDDPLERALWVRLRDEAHNPRAYRDVSPEGGFGDFVKTGAGEPRKIAWGSLNEVEKAMRSMASGGDLNIISPAMGSKHKVRSFYNNIETPNNPTFGDITADTHQVAAAQLRPLSGQSTAVNQNFGTSPMGAADIKDWLPTKSSSIVGVEGNYGLTADATREAARRLGMLPREAQSATWEPVRTLFEAKFKTPANAQAIDDIWRAVDAGQLDINTARKTILERAGGIGLPSWAEPSLPYTPAARASTYR